MNQKNNQQQTEGFSALYVPFLGHQIYTPLHDCSSSTRGEIPRTTSENKSSRLIKSVCRSQCRYTCVCATYEQLIEITYDIVSAAVNTCLIYKTLDQNKIVS
jgi:hypothetical protein